MFEQRDNRCLAVNSFRRRWFFQVVRDILSVEAGTKMDFMRAGRINSQQLRRYLTFLVRNGLATAETFEEDVPGYAITRRGRSALSKLDEIIALLGIEEMDEEWIGETSALRTL
jgi:predicted transcriptional regulator